MQVELASRALRMAIQQQRPQAGLIHHADRGVKYASRAYRDALSGARITASMSRKADCYDNAPIESFFHILKTELVHHCNYKTRAEASSISLPSSRASTIEQGSIPPSDISPRWKWS
jgi:transposase InsO family protein